ncbi:fumarylacetoacetate hydrolase family protein [soil metagenome]
MLDLEAIAARLDDAALHARATPQLAEALTLEEAYRVQACLLERRYLRGERRVGIKMGFTSRAKMAQMGIDDVIWGRLTDAMQVANGGQIDLASFVHPRVEPEIAFLLSAPLGGRVTPAEALAAVGGVAPALEIIDSRYRDFKFSLTDVVADNSSSAAFVVGSWSAPETDLSSLAMTLHIDGVARQVGSSSAILGDPILSLIAAARLAHEAGDPLRSGDIVLAGGATAAEPLDAGQRIHLDVEVLGQASFSVGPAS